MSLPAPIAGGALQPLQARAAAIEAKRAPVAGRAMLLIGSAFVFTAIAWASLADIDRIVIGRGKVITVDPPIVVQPLTTAVVRSIDVRVGQATDGIKATSNRPADNESARRLG